MNLMNVWKKGSKKPPGLMDDSQGSLSEQGIHPWKQWFKENAEFRAHCSQFPSLTGLAMRKYHKINQFGRFTPWWLPPAVAIIVVPLTQWQPWLGIVLGLGYGGYTFVELCEVFWQEKILEQRWGPFKKINMYQWYRAWKSKPWDDETLKKDWPLAKEAIEAYENRRNWAIYLGIDVSDIDEHVQEDGYLSRGHTESLENLINDFEQNVQSLMQSQAYQEGLPSDEGVLKESKIFIHSPKTP